jgi:hypothetical protein
MSMSVSLYRVTLPHALQQRIPVDYTSDLRECFEDTVCAKEQRGRQMGGEDEDNRRFL